MSLKVKWAVLIALQEVAILLTTPHYLEWEIERIEDEVDYFNLDLDLLEQGIVWPGVIGSTLYGSIRHTLVPFTEF